MLSVAVQRQRLRQQIRQQRRALTALQQQRAAQDITRHALTYPPVSTANNVALFLSVDGEPDTSLLIEALWQQGKTVCLPVLHPFSAGQLLFLRYEASTPLHINHLKIPEPPLDLRLLVPLAKLDVILLPLVAFDKTGQRLGMGGGYYDRTLQQHQQYAFHHVGLAHDCQLTEHVPDETWDVPLSAVITPAKIWQW
ncbi:5-formyltetrahydrofolate cyclo-ligase [Enterobacteriaceae bacterium LUAb1]